MSTLVVETVAPASGTLNIDGALQIGGGSLSETIADTVGAMVSSNTESGISVTYQDGDNTLDFDVADFNITLTGAVTGAGTVTNLGNVSIATTATADPTLTLSGDASGSATFTNLGNATLTVDVSSITGNLGVSGTVTAADFNTTSDISLKQNINVIDSALSKISQLNGYTFNWKNNDKEAVGIMAQEVEKVLPQIVATGEDGYKKVSYDSLIPLLIEAVKELSAKVK